MQKANLLFSVATITMDKTEMRCNKTSGQYYNIGLIPGYWGGVKVKTFCPIPAKACCALESGVIG